MCPAPGLSLSAARQKETRLQREALMGAVRAAEEMELCIQPCLGPALSSLQAIQDSVQSFPTFCFFKKNQTTEKFTEYSHAHPHILPLDPPVVRHLVPSVVSLSLALYIHIFVLNYLKTSCLCHNTSPLNISMCTT